MLICAPLRLLLFADSPPCLHSWHRTWRKRHLGGTKLNIWCLYWTIAMHFWLCEVKTMSVAAVTHLFILRISYNKVEGRPYVISRDILLWCPPILLFVCCCPTLVALPFISSVTLLTSCSDCQSPFYSQQHRVSEGDWDKARQSTFSIDFLFSF